MVEISLRPVAETDLPLLRSWLEQPHWQKWWDDPDTELDSIRAMVAGRDSTRPYLFSADGVPAGYIQMWLARDAKVEPFITEAPWLSSLPDGCVGVDLSIGPAGMLSRGIGSAALRAFVAFLRAEGHRDIIIDPDPANARAIRAYEKAGFRPIRDLAGRTEDCLLMRHSCENDTP